MNGSPHPVMEALTALSDEMHKLLDENERFRAGQTILRIQPAKSVSNRPKLSAEDASHIRELKRSGYTQAEIARAYDINPATVSRIVRGQYHA